MTKGLQSAARTSCPLTADKTHTCSLSCIFCQVHAPTENDQNPFAACGRQTLRGFFDRLTYKVYKNAASEWEQIHEKNIEDLFNGEESRFAVLSRYQLPENLSVAVSVASRVTLQTQNGPKDYLLLRAIPTDEIRNT